MVFEMLLLYIHYTTKFSLMKKVCFANEMKKKSISEIVGFYFFDIGFAYTLCCIHLDIILSTKMGNKRDYRKLI